MHMQGRAPEKHDEGIPDGSRDMRAHGSSALACGVLLLTLMAAAFPREASAQSPKWVSAYYGGWQQGGRIKPEEIDYTAVTHIIHFALIVSPDGTFSGEGNGITVSSALAAVRAAHGAGKKILISVGGADSDAGFSGAASPGNRSRFITRLLEFMNTCAYDGIDVDWEPVPVGSLYVEFIRDLRKRLSSTGSLLFTAVMTGTDRSILAGVAPYVDQINLMTYDMSGPWTGWQTWHNSPLYDGGAHFQSTGGPLPSIDQVVRDKIAGGVPAEKLGIGIDFYGYRWQGGEGTSTGGVSKPGQTWKTDPDVKANVPYFELMDTYYRSCVSWDSAAGASYIGIDSPGAAQDEFVSFENERSIRAKADYVKRMDLGGVIVYELGAGYRRNLPEGYRDLLLKNVRYAFLGGKEPPADRIPPSVQIKSPGPGSRISGTALVSAEVTDNTAVECVEFRIDGRMAAPVVSAPPYTVSINSWRYGNGRHTLEIAAYDAFGNSAKREIGVTIRNEGRTPVRSDRVVFDGTLHPPFIDASWGATVRFGIHDKIKSRSGTAAVSYLAWGAFDLLSGTWHAESPLDPVEFDTLRADIYPLEAMKLKVAFYTNTTTVVALKAGEWNSIAVPLGFSRNFSRFYFQSLLDTPVTCYFDNIRFTAASFRDPIMR